MRSHVSFSVSRSVSMSHPQGAVFVIPLRPRRLLLPALLLAGLAALLFTQSSTTAARHAPVPGDPPAELRLLPPDTFFVAHVNVAGLLDREIVKTVLPVLVTMAGADPEKIGLSEFGVPLRDIESFAFL